MSDGHVSPSDDIYRISSRSATISIQNDAITYLCQSLPTTLNRSNQINIVLKVKDDIRMFHSVCIERRADLMFLPFLTPQTENCIVSSRQYLGKHKFLCYFQP
jgi:hypothetical protein